MLLVDASAFIDAHRRSTGLREQRCREVLLRVGGAERLGVCGVTAQEVLAGARNDENAERLTRQLAAFHVELATTDDHIEAAAILRRLRAVGLTIGNADTLVIATTRRTGARVLATDRDFERARALVEFELVFVGGETGGG